MINKPMRGLGIPVRTDPVVGGRRALIVRQEVQVLSGRKHFITRTEDWAAQLSKGRHCCPN